MQPHIRASDAERQRVVDLLQEHTTAGRLSLDEFSTRVDAANRAVTRGDLAVLTADLPTPAQPRPDERPWPTGLVVAGIVVAVVLLVAIIAAMAGWMHMGPMMGR